MPTLQSITIRMYYTGFGDCFLLTFRYSDNSAKTLWIDFGAKNGKSEPMRVIARHLKQYLTDAGLVRDGKPLVDVLAITHEHQDHISGFKQAAAELGLDDDNSANDPLEIGQVWFAWTEDPNNDLAKAWRGHKRASRLALQKATQQVAAMAAAPAGLVSRLGMLAGFEFAAHETDDDSQNPTPANTQQLNFDFALHNSYEALIAKVNQQNVHYLRPGHTDPDKSVHPGDLIGKVAGSVPGATIFPGMTLFVLGPPEDLSIIRAGEPEWDNSLRVNGFSIGESHFAHADEDPENTKPEDFWYYVRKAPFDEEFVLPIDLDRQKLPDGVIQSYHQQTPVSQRLTKQFGKLKKTDVFNHYFDNDQAWRQINSDYLMGTDDLGIKLNTGMNNTSLVLAMEIGQTGEVLFFSGDAEFGVWNDWEKDRTSPDRVGKRQYTWTLPDHSDQTRPPRTVTAEDLMARTVFYKMGHHGSHNATPNKRGVAKLSNPNLHSMIPVDGAMAENFKWDIPYERLTPQFGGRTIPHIRSDEATDATIAEAQRLSDANPLPSGAVVTWSKDPDGDLYVDWKLTLP